MGIPEGRKVTGNAFLTRSQKEGTTGHGNRSEKRVAKDLGARLQPASGAMVGAKSDARLKGVSFNFRIENKATVNMTLPIQLDWLVKISKESLQDGSIPVLAFSFVTPEGKPRSAMNSDWVAMPKTYFQELLEAAEGKE